MSTQGAATPTEEELRAAYEAELKRLRVEDVLVQTVVSLLNLGGRKAGLAPGTEDERDPDQVRLAIEGARALLPLVEPELGAEAPQSARPCPSCRWPTRRRGGAAPASPGRPGADAPPEPPAARGWSGAGAGPDGSGSRASSAPRRLRRLAPDRIPRPLGGVVCPARMPGRHAARPAI